MNRKSMSKIIAGLCFMVTSALVHSGLPLWTLTPLTATTITVGANETATISYQVTNQSKKTHTLVMKPIPGITQITTPGNCQTSFVLGYQQENSGLSIPNGSYWSSTEWSVAAQSFAWSQLFASGGSSSQTAFSAKNTRAGVRCSRALS